MSGIKQAFYNVSDYDNNSWTANQNLGFLFDNFDINNLSSQWHILNGSYHNQMAIYLKIILR